MKKSILNIVAVAAIVLVSFTSCEKKAPAEAIADTTDTLIAEVDTVINAIDSTVSAAADTVKAAITE